MKGRKEGRGRGRGETGRGSEHTQGASHLLGDPYSWTAGTPQGVRTRVLLMAVNCRRVSALAKGRYCSHNAPGEAPSSSFQDGCRQPPAEADKELGLRAQEPSLPSPLQAWLS